MQRTRRRSTWIATALAATLLTDAATAEARRGQRRINIAIDGPSGVGKSSTAKAVARRLGYTFVDTGACYRSLALYAKNKGVPLTDGKGVARLARRLPISFSSEKGVNRVFLDGKDVSNTIRQLEISRGASVVAGHAGVRTYMTRLQRRLAGKGGAVLEGRDIGTNVLPGARLKIFLTAKPEERARRHQSMLRQRGQQVPYGDVLKMIKERDLRDRTREHNPLRQARDAVLVDSTHKGFDAVVDTIVTAARKLQ